MLINVVYNNNRHDVVPASLVQKLIVKNLVKKFLRSSGWVSIGVDPIRSMIPPLSYSGPERRRTDSAASLPLHLLSTPFSPSDPE